MPCILADEHRGATPARVESADLEPAIHEALLVEQPVGRKENFPVYVADYRGFAAEGCVERTVVDGVVPDLIEPESDVERLE